PDDPGGHGRRRRLRPAPGRAAGGAGRPGPSGAAHPGRLRRQEPPDQVGRGRARPLRGERRRRRYRDLGVRGRRRGRFDVKHLLGIDDLGADGIAEVLRLADSFLEVTRRDIPKVPALRGKTVVSMFYEDSTRTRLSFETAAKRLSADTMTFSAGSSSLRKGESLLDTVRTVEAMGLDAIVVRHKSSGVPQRIAGWIDASIINAGDGWHEHPAQALLDAFT